MNYVSDLKDLTGKKVLIRADLDVPLDNGKILNTFRLDHSLETIKHVISIGGFPLIIGKIGKPKNATAQSLVNTPKMTTNINK